MVGMYVSCMMNNLLKTFARDKHFKVQKLKYIFEFMNIECEHYFMHT